MSGVAGAGTDELGEAVDNTNSLLGDIKTKQDTIITNQKLIIANQTNKDQFTQTIESNGIPKEYTSISSTSKIRVVAKGQLNKLRIRPGILNEHAESSREIMDVVDATTIVGQMFKASSDNITSLMLTLESAAGSTLDDFESYADSTALQVVWILAGTTEAELETSVVKSGSKSMRLPLTTVSDEWQDTVGATNYTDYTFSLDFQQSVLFGVGGAEVSFFIGDGANTKSISLAVDTPNGWEHFEIDENAMSEDGGTTNMAAITEIGFRNDRKRVGASAYVDNLTVTAKPGSVMLKLWDCGATLPVADGATFDLTNDATQYTELGDRGLNGGTFAATVNLPLQGGKRVYEITDFAAGPALEIPSNTLLTPGNYYAVTINYVDTDVSVYGPDTTHSKSYYKNGYGFYTANEGTDITTIPGSSGAGAYSDLMFGIFSNQDVYFTSFFQFIATSSGSDATIGSGTSVSFFAEDNNMKITNIASHNSSAAQEIQADLTFRPFFMVKGSKFEMYYNDDFSDDVFAINLTGAYAFIPPVANG